MTIASWYFEPYQATGGATAGAFRNSLSNAGRQLDLADLLAREAIQNSVDAARDKSQPVRMAFSQRRLDEGQLPEFLKLLGLVKSGDSPLDRTGLLASEPQRPLQDHLRAPLDLLLIEDYATVGLTGTWDSRKPAHRDDNFTRLCLELGGTKEIQLGRGGTYGYGKSVCWVASPIWTVVLYSHFDPSPRSEDVDARLVAVSWFEEHEHDGTRFTGRAWYGETSDENGQTLVKPLLGEAAHEMASGLGFKVREAGATGLSLMIIGADLDLTSLQRGVEKWWWPRLLDGGLEVLIGKEHRPQPRTNRKLRRFVRAWDLLRNNATTGEEETVLPLSYKGPLGRFAVTAYRDEDVEPTPPKEEVETALVRGPGMVVEYYQGTRIQLGHPQCDAVFLADSEMDATLAKSEPPAHDRWDHKFTRGDRPLSDHERRRIKKLLAKVRSQTREFLNRHRDEPPTPPDRCRELERLLGKHLKAQRHKPPQPEGAPRPFRIRFLEQPHRSNSDGNVVLDAKVEISLSDNAEPKEYLCELRCWVETLVERNHVGASLPMDFMEIRTQDGDTQLGLNEDRQSSGACLLREDERATIDLRSAPLPHPEYAARFVVQAEDRT